MVRYYYIILHILHCIVLGCILLYGLSSTAAFVDSFIDRTKGRPSKWAVDGSIVRWFIGWIIDRAIHSYNHTCAQSIIRWLAHSLIGWPIPLRIMDLVVYYYTILYYNALYYIVLHYTLIYDKVIYYIIFRRIVLRCIVLYGPALTASFVGSFVERFNGRPSKWAGYWPVLTFI